MRYPAPALPAQSAPEVSLLAPRVFLARGLNACDDSKTCEDDIAYGYPLRGHVHQGCPPGQPCNYNQISGDVNSKGHEDLLIDGGYRNCRSFDRLLVRMPLPEY